MKIKSHDRTGWWIELELTPQAFRQSPPPPLTVARRWCSNPRKWLDMQISIETKFQFSQNVQPILIFKLDPIHIQFLSQYYFYFFATKDTQLHTCTFMVLLLFYLDLGMDLGMSLNCSPGSGLWLAAAYTCDWCFWVGWASGISSICRAQVSFVLSFLRILSSFWLWTWRYR